MRRNPPLSDGSPATTLTMVALMLGLVAPLSGLAEQKPRGNNAKKDEGSVDPFSVVDAAAEPEKKKKAKAKSKSKKKNLNVVEVPLPLPGRASQVKVQTADQGDGAVDPFAYLADNESPKKATQRKRNQGRKKKDAAVSAIAGGAVDPFDYLADNAAKETAPKKRSPQGKDATVSSVVGGAVDPFAHLEASEAKTQAQRDRDLKTEPDPLRKPSSKKGQKKQAEPATKGDGAVDPFDVLGR